MYSSAMHEGGHLLVKQRPAPTRCAYVRSTGQRSNPAHPTFNLPPRSSVLLDCFKETLVLLISPPLSLLSDDVRFTSLRGVG